MLLLNAICSIKSAAPVTVKDEPKLLEALKDSREVLSYWEAANSQDSWILELRQNDGILMSAEACIFEEGAQYTTADAACICTSVLFLNTNCPAIHDFPRYKVPKYTSVGRGLSIFNSDTNP